MTGQGKDLMVPPGDAKALAGKIQQLATNAAHRAALQNWAAHHARRFDVAMVGPDYVALLKEALQTGH